MHLILVSNLVLLVGRARASVRTCDVATEIDMSPCSVLNVELSEWEKEMYVREFGEILPDVRARSPEYHYPATHPTPDANDDRSDPPKKFVCEICCRSFKYRNNLCYHRKDKHPDVKREIREYRCEVCGYIFQHYLALYHHESLRHADANTPKRVFECEMCGKECTSKAGLANHTNWTHVKKKCVAKTDTDTNGSRNCKLCSLPRIPPSEVLGHTKTEHSLATEMCPAGPECGICNNKHSWRGSLLVNIKRGAESAGACTKNDLRTCKCEDFMSNHRCRLCGATYHSLWNLRRHTKLAHKASKQTCLVMFGCKVCTKTYKKQSNLRKHTLKKHPGYSTALPGKLPCGMCDKSYSHPSTLQAHVIAKHCGTAGIGANTGVTIEQST